ncbi:hypothetical protein COT44_02320 [Candidatus Shapirobacteria bacterium CG08_land_8_20_14_0_20_39_18]|uniref:FHA domain-containing protein n=1 Tax=Candidatus Shapirobacteria bacterium CG08_land_8_20_14_0_20_39_18 TaxID=1974883 RepID=A0A2M6XD89_9BACT|nr:MAG: hypothetical protein COT44_02320 [Candidatus Shapirobacteria bacterium CG08_land_8_20_14_0_20_39_18]PIY66175.1 MAG: hypothetical protein COY91_01590 [Candidatus Shapirobacteria bacterium CG_4_10_14_0_8_um_filter_39_15]
MIKADPKTFNPDFPQTGYKGLWDSQEVSFGRYYPYRFEYSSSVSREHLKIKVENDQITITDLNSSNGSTVTVRENNSVQRQDTRAVYAERTRDSEPEDIFERAGKK